MKFKFLIGILFLFTFSVGCRKDTDISNDNNALQLMRNQSSPTESYNNVEKGLKWALAAIGANNFNAGGLERKEGGFLVYHQLLGLSKTASDYLEKLHQSIRQTEEFQIHGAIDLGRYITLLVGASEHYYRLVEIPNHIDELLNQYDLGSQAGYVNSSGVSYVDRLIYFSDQVGFNQVFVSHELNEELEIEEYETIELMANGQLKFGIFDGDGNRINAADPSKTAAGKPAKCMWCHEANIQTLVESQENVDGFLTNLAFADTLNYFRMNHTTSQMSIDDVVNYMDQLEHVQMELLYISFMEPSAYRLSKEWNMSKVAVEELLSGLSTHIHGEFSFLGELYYRSEVEEFAPFSSLKTSSKVREFSDEEVNYLE